jgi:hypothetical protein
MCTPSEASGDADAGAEDHLQNPAKSMVCAANGQGTAPSGDAASALSPSPEQPVGPNAANAANAPAAVASARSRRACGIDKLRSYWKDRA